MDDSFKPAWWLPGPHLQTLWPALVRRKVRILIDWERFELADGDFLDLAWINRAQEGTPIVIVLHGLNGSIHSPYASGILRAIQRQGWRGVLMHFRGCSGEPNRLARSYHSGETGDLHSVISELKRREPNTPLFAIGYSLGGNVLLKSLGETRHKTHLSAAVAVSIPFELAKTTEHLSVGFSRLYQWQLMRSLTSAHKKKFKNIPFPQNSNTIDQLKTFKEFDNLITAPLHGFKDAEEYYTSSSSRQFLAGIEIPTLILHARNDPFTHLSSLPQHHEISNSVTLEILEEGGHVGFVAGKYPWKPIYWLEQRIIRYLTEFILPFK